VGSTESQERVTIHREVLLAKKKVKGAGSSTRKIEQYCSVCKKTFKMPVVEEADNHDVIWLKCPECQGFLPYMLDSVVSGEGTKNYDVSTQTDTEDLALEDIDQEKAREYRESNEYKIGEIIYHRSWNDYGKVVSKEILPGHRKTIVVQFVNQGRIRLLEGVA
jgi:hypothetical protein